MLLKIWKTNFSVLFRHLSSIKYIYYSVEKKQFHSSNMVNSQRSLHVPVMVQQVIEHIRPQDGKVIVDMTFGAGGHSQSLLAVCPRIRLFALDRDVVANSLAVQLANTHLQVTPLRGKFTDIRNLLAAYGLEENTVDAFLFDVGASSMQFDDAARGFALSLDGPLDMRMDRDNQTMTAGDIVNYMPENGLYEIIKKYGEEKKARLIARAIVDTRYTYGHITSTTQLAGIVASVDSGFRSDKLNREAHVATKTFQALRIAVNDELNELHNGLELAYHLLKPGGICVAITFHSLEDRIVKRHFHGIDIDEVVFKSITDRYRYSRHVYPPSQLQQCTAKKWECVSKSILSPLPEEVNTNPRSRSAKLRAAYKL